MRDIIIGIVQCFQISALGKQSLEDALTLSLLHIDLERTHNKV